MGSQIRIVPDGLWHRRERGNGGDRTACGEPIAGAFASRDQTLDDHLCEECFTRHELDTGQMKKIVLELKREVERDTDDLSYFDPDDEPTDPTGGTGGV